jgi:hypothetical protein
MTASIRAQSLSKPPIPEPKDGPALQAGRQLQNLAEIEQMLGYKLDGLKGIKVALWALLRSK